MVAFKSLILKTFTTESYSCNVNYASISEKVAFYRSQLGFPEKDSKEFQEMSEELQRQVERFYLPVNTDVNSWLEEFDGDDTDGNTSASDEGKADVTMLDSPYSFVYLSLNCVLNTMNEVALNILNEARYQNCN
jgi:hypothetical protein